ncbi:MAG: hypothetical protein K0R54_201 [Clostridiaceae bacterium]|jgi:hypothetical protein|nr:hypothetical protein [Clostridiaceae bacterium]
MIFDLTIIDYTKEITNQLKEQHFRKIDKMITNETFDNNDDSTITVYHGTSLYYLNDILLKGILPRDTTGIGNYSNEIASNKNLVYLTNKWHYFYAYNAFNSLNKSEIDTGSLNIPCYVECKVPAKYCVIDEDFFHSNYIKQRLKSAIKKGNTTLEINYSECHAMYGTIAYLGAVPREYIKSFTILANIELLHKNFIDNNSKYQKQLRNWANGKGKGDLKLIDLANLEDDEYNVTFGTKDIPENYIITGVEPTQNSNVKYRLRFNEVKK